MSSETVEQDSELEQGFEREMMRMVMNAMSSRIDFMNRMTDPRRNIEKECGHPNQDETILVGQYAMMYSRNPVAARVVEVLPRQSWQVQPVVYESEEAKVRTRFERVWKSIPKQLWGEKCYYQDDEGNPLWEFLRRADELSGIGRFGVILMGIADGRRLDEPIAGMENLGELAEYNLDQVDPDRNGSAGGGYFYSYNEVAQSLPKFDLPPEREDPSAEQSKTEDVGKGLRQLTFLRAFSEDMVVIDASETDEKSPRYGQPTYYRIALTDHVGDQLSTTAVATKDYRVHWTRVIHVADNRKTSEVYGTPRCQEVYDELLDCKKLASGSAEMYWNGAFPGLSLESHPQLGDGVQINEKGTRRMMEAYRNGLQRWLTLVGMSAKTLAPQVVDPTPQLMAQIMLICIKIGVPKRKFMGSEQGEKASTQDDANWNDELRSRQQMYVSPRIIRPFVNRLIAAKVLPEPKGFSIYWPDLSSQTTQEKSQTAVSVTQALVQYVQGGLYTIMTPLDFLITVVKLTESEAIAVLKRAKAEQTELSKLFEKFTPAGQATAKAEQTGNKTFPGGKDNSKKVDPKNMKKPKPKPS